MGSRGAGATLIDDALVIRSQAGDEDAIAELAGQVRPLVTRYAGRFFSEPSRAEDLAQTAMMKAFARLGDVRAPEAFYAWLLRITRNECLNELARSRHPQVPLSTLEEQGADLEEPAGGAGDPEESLARAQLQAMVRSVAQTLPDHYRQTLVMRALEDRSYEDISEELAVPVTVARLWYCRARKRFRTAFVEAMVTRRGVPGPCQAMGVSIAEMIEGTLAKSDRGRVSEHLGGCNVCRQTEDELRNTAFRAPSRAALVGLGLLAGPARAAHIVRRGLGAAHHAARSAATAGVGSATMVAAGVVTAVAVTGGTAAVVEHARSAAPTAGASAAQDGALGASSALAAGVGASATGEATPGLALGALPSGGLISLGGLFTDVNNLGHLLGPGGLINLRGLLNHAAETAQNTVNNSPQKAPAAPQPNGQAAPQADAQPAPAQQPAAPPDQAPPSQPTGPALPVDTPRLPTPPSLP
jgi:RNA polymerase sigma-70 factor (ECF subfamily)